MTFKTILITLLFVINCQAYSYNDLGEIAYEYSDDVVEYVNEYSDDFYDFFNEYSPYFYKAYEQMLGGGIESIKRIKDFKFDGKTFQYEMLFCNDLYCLTKNGHSIMELIASTYTTPSEITNQVIQNMMYAGEIILQ